MPANEAEAVSSAVADDRTATGGSPALDSSAPYALVMASRMSSGMSSVSIEGAHLSGRLLQGGRVVDVEVVQPLGNRGPQPGALDERGVGRGADHEAVRHR